MIRTFIAVEISDEVAQAMLAEVARLKPHFPRINWVKPDNLHLTLKFIGNLPPDDLPDIFEAAEQAAEVVAPFSLEVIGSGAFPDLTHPRVIYAGCGEGAELATELAGNVQEFVTPLGFPPEPRLYTPHFTLGRIKQPADARGIEAFAEEMAARRYGVVEVSEIVVYMSELKKQGARHTPMQRIALRG